MRVVCRVFCCLLTAGYTSGRTEFKNMSLNFMLVAVRGDLALQQMCRETGTDATLAKISTSLM